MRKKFFYPATALLLAASLTMTSCIGSFNLTHKLLSWNQTVDSKFVNAVIFAILAPVYSVTVTVDALVLNTIEFWSGDNPVQAGVVKKVKGDNGLLYTIETTKSGYSVKDENGKEMNFTFDKKTKTWSLVENGQTIKLVKIVDDKNAIAYVNGQEINVPLNQNGVLAFQQVVENRIYRAQR